MDIVQIPQEICADHIEMSIELGQLIGEGAFSKVHIATFIPRNGNLTKSNLEQKRFAIKCIHKNVACTDSIVKLLESAKREIFILSKCAHLRCVARMYLSWDTFCTKYILMELCSGGDMHTLLSTRGISRNEAICYISEIAAALGYLHQLSIVYHDLKLENLCLDQDGFVKIIDFGLAIILNESHYNRETNRREIISDAGTAEYSAPEIFWRQPHAFEADWWSFGVLSYELLCGEHPFAHDGSILEQCEYICSNAGFHRNDIISRGSVEESFLSMFLVKEGKLRFGYRRVDVNQILRHQLFDQLDPMINFCREINQKQSQE